MKVFTKGSSLLNSFFDEVYVVSLPNTQKRSYLHSYLEKHKIGSTIVEGIDGNIDRSINKLYNDYLSWGFSDPRSHALDEQNQRKCLVGPGAIGLINTYIKIFEDAIAKEHKYILCLEEDILISSTLEESFKKFIESFSSFDLLFLGASQHGWNGIEFKQLSSDFGYYLANQKTCGTFALGYNCSLLPDLLKLINLRNAPIDSGPICDMIKNRKDSCYVLYPNQIIAETSLKSSISGKSRNLRYHKEVVKWNLSGIDFSSNSWKVSVLIANHNSSSTIESTLSSLKHQVYKNLEVVIVDDNSTDDSLEKISNFSKSNPDLHISVLPLYENVGAYTCRNIALKNSTGFFVTLLDSDDVLMPNKIYNDIYNYFNINNCKLFFSKIYRSNSIRSSLDISSGNPGEFLSLVDNERCEYEELPEDKKPWSHRIRFGIQTIFTDREFFEKYGFWRSDFRYGMDINLVQRYVFLEHNKFIPYKELWLGIYKNELNHLGIHLSDDLGLISFKMNEANATLNCDQRCKDHIHSICEKEFLTDI